MIEREFPYSNLHDANIDWILKIVKEFNEKYHSVDEMVAQMIAQINAAGEQAVSDITEGKDTALQSIQNFLYECKALLLATKSTSINEMLAVRDDNIAAVNRVGSDQQNLVIQEGVSALANIQAAIATIPQDYSDALARLQIINSILDETGNYPGLIQGYYAADFTLTSSDNIVSSVLLSGIADKTVHIKIDSGTAIINHIKLWTGYGSSAIQTLVSMGGTEAVYTFGSNITFASIVFTYDSQGETALLPTDFTATFKWSAKRFESIESEIENISSVIYGTPKEEIYNLTSGKRYNLAPGNNQLQTEPHLQNGTGKYVIFDLGIAKNNGEITIYLDELTTNSTVGCLFVDANNLIVKRFVSSATVGFKYDSTLNKYVYSAKTGTAVTFHFSIYGGSNSITVYLKSPELEPDLVYVDETSGDDDNLGTSDAPVKTVKRAMEMKAKEIHILSDLHQSFEVNRDVVIFGKGYCIYGDVELSTESYNNILKAEYEADTKITNCFVSHSTALTENVDGSAWKGPKYNICCFADDTKLLPVSDIATCEATDNSFTWYDGYFYINATGTRFSYVTSSHIIDITHGKLTLNDAKIKHSTSDCIQGDLCTLEMNGCTICGSVNLNCVSISNGTLIARNCDVSISWNDGINTHGRGDSTIINCTCHDCSDDGISQHDNTTGVIIGGEFYSCGKGGISSPINSAIIDIYNAYVHDNNSENANASGYGIYSSASSSSPVTFRIFGCVISNNKVGIRIAKNTALVYGCSLYGNTRNTQADQSGSIFFLG